MKDFKVIFLILVITFFVFLPCLYNGWVNWDDTGHILANPPKTIFDSKIFTSLINKTYIPLTTLSFSLEYHWIKFGAFYYHLDNLILYFFDIILVFYLARRLGISLVASAFGALLFSLDTLNV
jgi:hypothetical protein